MTKRRLLLRLREIANRQQKDPVRDLDDAGIYLSDFIDDVEITQAFHAIAVRLRGGINE